MKKILVTGGAGFIGSHLCERLLESGSSVICLDNFLTGSERNVSHLKDNRQFTLVNADVEYLPFFECDEIYNLACPASPVQYQNDGIRTIRTSVIGALKVLELGNITGAKVLQASTSEVYGDPAVHPQPESYWGNVNTVGPRSCYDEGKRCAETLFINFNTQERVRVKIIRIFNTYGPRMQPDDGRVISNFIVQALRGENLTIFGDGTHTRSFQYIDDLITGMIRMMDTGDEFTGPVNLGNPTEFRIIDLAKLIIRLTGSSSGIDYQKLPGDDPKQRKPDISLASRVLGWKPEIDLEYGLTETIRYFRNELSLHS
ncbi:MAG: UDP-glucuronic acid decarboxylase family protein [Bacteroidales bacterium]